MPDTAILGLPMLAEAQNQKYLTINQSLSYLDSLVNLTVFNRTQNTPPSSPSEGDRYIVGDSPTGVFTGETNRVAVYLGTSWVFFSPTQGWRAYDQSEAEIITWNGTSWTSLESFLGTLSQSKVSEEITTVVAESTSFSQLRIVQEEELVDLSSGAIVSSTIFFPNRSIPLFASVFNKQAITGPSGFQWYTYEFGSVAHSFEDGFAGNISLGQQQSGPANPMKPIFSDATVDFEDFAVAAGSGTGTAFTGGQVRLTISYMESSAGTT